jgi:CheY-like chemotaxis protein
VGHAAVSHPLQNARSPGGRLVDIQRTGFQTGFDMNARRLLIADDEIHLTQIVSHNLTKGGAVVSVARNGFELIAMATAELPDLIVSDYQMPGLDGFQACRQLRADPRTAEIPVIMLTARGHRLPPEELATTNIKLLMPKPFSARELIKNIETILQSTLPSATAA